MARTNESIPDGQAGQGPERPDKPDRVDADAIANVRRLAIVLGCSKTVASERAREPWFPPRRPDGTWSRRQVLAAVEQHERPPAAPAPTPDDRPDRDLHAVLESSRDPVELARAAVPLAARRFAAAHDRGDIREVTKTTSDFARALEELRRTEAGMIELRKAREEVVSVDDMRAVGAKVGRKFVEACERLESRLAAQVEVWLADEQFRTLEPAVRGRSVRAWVASQTNVARTITADEVKSMVDAEASS